MSVSLPVRTTPFLFHYARLFWHDVATIFGLAGICRVILLMVPVWLGMIVDGLSLHQKQATDIWATVGTPFLLIVIVGFPLRGLLYRWLITIDLRYQGALVARLRSDLFEYTRKHSLSYFKRQFSGALSTKIQSVSDTVRGFMFMLAADMFRPFISYVVALAVLFHTYPLLGWLLSAWIGIFVTLSMRLSFCMKQLATADAEAKSIVGGYLADAFSNIMTILSFSQGDQESRYAAGVFEQAHVAQVAKDKRSMFVSYMLETADILLAVSMMIGLFYGYIHGQVTVGGFAVVMPLAMNVAENTRSLLFSAVQIFENYGIIQNGLDTLLLPYSITDRPDAKPLVVSSGTVTFENVCFGYRPEHPLFKKLNIQIAGGEKIGIVGQSGAGKTTFINLLQRLYEPSQGRIFIDGQDQVNVTLDSLRASIAVIPQDTGLFHRSLADNIRYGYPGATDKQVMEAARQAHAHEFISALPEGYETLVGEKGAQLSGGQRQRIAIARAVIKNAPILILDEATSALDSESERLIQESLHTIMKGRTVIAIAHRLSTLTFMDRLLVLQEGSIVEEGSHAALLAARGVYARLWALQSGDSL